MVKKLLEEELLEEDKRTQNTLNVGLFVKVSPEKQSTPKIAHMSPA